MVLTPDLLATDLAPRGVYRAKCLDENGNTILLVVDSRHRRLPLSQGGARVVMPGENILTVAEEMWDKLNEVDPVPTGHQNGLNGFTAAAALILTPLMGLI